MLNELLVHFYLNALLRFEIICGNKKPFKNDGKRFLFYLKGSFRSQDI